METNSGASSPRSLRTFSPPDAAFPSAGMSRGALPENLRVRSANIIRIQAHRIDETPFLRHCETYLSDGRCQDRRNSLYLLSLLIPRNPFFPMRHAIRVGRIPSHGLLARLFRDP